MLRYKLLTFDANNTLIRVRNSVGYHYRLVAKECGVEAKAPNLNRAFKTAYKQQVKLHPNFGAVSGLTTEEWWNGVVQHTFQDAGVNCGEDSLAKVASKLFDYYGTTKAWETFPEVKEMLTFLNRNGIALGVLSNNDERLIGVLKSVDLATHFSFILPSFLAKCEKPNAEFFTMALDRFKIDPKMSAHIGDSVTLDYLPAKAVGMDAYLIDRDGYLAESQPDIDPKHILSDFTDLESLIFEQ